MSNNSFNPTSQLRVAYYLRMSTEFQNPRSPDQQKDTIEATYKRLGYPWIHVKTYRDDGISGRFNLKRPGFKEMLGDIRSETTQVDAILVDTFERFGRNDELEAIRRNLHVKHGVLILTADTNFSDPTTSSGRVVSMFERLRATEENRIKGHNVRRGKKDAVLQGQWVGAEAPFGYKLEPVFINGKSGQEVAHRKLVPDESRAWLIQRIFDMAGEQGLGSSRIAKILNEDPEVPKEFKPFFDQTVIHWLKKEIYYGEMVWGKKLTSVVNDRYIAVPNPESDMIRIPDYCKPLVSKELWKKAEAVRKFRSDRTKNALKAKRNQGGKVIRPLAPGFALTYPLTGLVRCAVCQRSMTISVTQPYITKSGESKRYPSYHCPGYLSRFCSNGARIPEGWLFEQVTNLVKRRLLPPNGDEQTCSIWTIDSLKSAPWFHDLMNQIQKEVLRINSAFQATRPNYEDELVEISRQIQGWSVSLGNPELNIGLRKVIESDFGKAIERRREIETLLAQSEAQATHKNQSIDPATVLSCLNRLEEVLRGGSPSILNIELAMHIDSIRCDQERRVIVRTFKLGALAEVKAFMPRSGEDAPKTASAHSDIIPATPRRLGLRRTCERTQDSHLEEKASMAADVYRFSGFSEEWFWEDTFHVPCKLPWYQEFAFQVLEKKQNEGWSLTKLAGHFGKSKPTIQAALRYARHADSGKSAEPMAG